MENDTEVVSFRATEQSLCLIVMFSYKNEFTSLWNNLTSSSRFLKMKATVWQSSLYRSVISRVLMKSYDWFQAISDFH